MIADPKTCTIHGFNPENPNEKRNFTFDSTYNKESSQVDIFNETALPILTSVMEGYNGTIFAYGQTGTGKTFTMEGSEHPDKQGIIPRSIEWIFKTIEKSKDKEFLVHCSFLEIYNEEVRDLLAKDVKNKLNVREKDGAFYVEDCKKVRVNSIVELTKLMVKGKESRKTGATKMNPGSSRSHSLFTIFLENAYTDETGETKYRMGKLNLVDLAGSERQSKSEAMGERLKEATKINFSLSILGNVISALVAQKPTHIPYRESKLTMLLMDSLGGNTKTVMIANIGPADYNYNESLNTLWYAARAKKIKNKPKINEDPKDALLRSYQEEIETIKKQLAAMGKGGNFEIKQGESVVRVVNDESQFKKIVENLEEDKENFRKAKEQEILKIQEQKNIAEEEKRKLIEKINQEKEEERKKKEDTKKLLLKYKEMKSKVINSSEADKKVKQQEAEISKTNEELIAIKKEEERLKRALEEKRKNNLEIKSKYESKQGHIDDLNEKIDLARNKIERMKFENKESQEKLLFDFSALQEYISVMEKENKKKEFIISNFIPKEEKEKLKECIEFNEKEGFYFVNRIAAIKNNYLTNRKILKKMKKSQSAQFFDESSVFNEDRNFANVDILNLGLILPEKLIGPFTGEPNKHVLTDIEHILKDDDSDLLYFNKELDLFGSEVYDSNLSTNMTSKKQEARPRIATGKKK